MDSEILAMKGFSCRKVTPNDLPRLCDIINQSYRSEKCWTNEAQLVTGLRTTVEQLMEMLTTNILLLAETTTPTPPSSHQLAPTVVGCVCAELSERHAELSLPENAALLGLLAVDSNFQSQGIGSFLMSSMLKHVKGVGCTQVFIWVIQQRLDIQKWYERMGFEYTGATRDFVFPKLTLQPNTFFKIYNKFL